MTHETRFLNVDLDLRAKHDLAPLVEALGRRVFALHCEGKGRRFTARLELAKHPRSPDEGIRRFVSLVEGLPRAARALWDGADDRAFDIGVAPGTDPWTTSLPLGAETLRGASTLGARVVVCVYGFRPEAPAPEPRPATLATALVALRATLRARKMDDFGALLTEERIKSAIGVAIRDYETRPDATEQAPSRGTKAMFARVRRGEWPDGVSFTTFHAMSKRRGRAVVRHDGLGVRLEAHAGDDAFALPVLDAWFGCAGSD